jgi:small subunit ribosomal protein S16
MRKGKIRTPYFRIVVTDEKKARNGLSIEEIGRYVPSSDPSYIEVNSERAQHWLKIGAQPTEAVQAILKITGDWQKFKGLPGTEGTLKTIPAREDKKVRYEAAVKAAANEPADGATTLKKKAQDRLAEKAAPKEEAPVVSEPVAEVSEPVAESVVETAEAVVETPAVEVSEPVAEANVSEVPAEAATPAAE